MNIAGNDEVPAEFADFIASGDVEVGSEVAAAKEDAAEDKPVKPKKAPPKAAPKAAAEGDDDQGEGDQPGSEIEASGEGDDDQGGEGDDEGKPEKSPRDHQIERLKREKAELARQLRENSTSAIAQRLEKLEKGLSPENHNGSQATEIAPAPDPTDSEKYPLGHLDDRYIEDKLEWLTDKKATERADAVLQRQQAFENQQAVERQQTELLEKVDTLAARGTELFEDFQEAVVEAGMRGDWDLSQTTFEAAHEAENGAQILYDLSQDKAEATRVAKLSPLQQLKFVAARDEELSKAAKPRTTPKAGDPPRNLPRGANSRTQINPATDNLDDFEKAWAADVKKNH